MQIKPLKKSMGLDVNPHKQKNPINPFIGFFYVQSSVYAMLNGDGKLNNGVGKF